MDLGKILMYRQENEAESLDYQGIIEIEQAYSELPDESLRDERENATISDMLDELEDAVTPLERNLYEYILANYGQSEASDPSYSTKALAEHLSKRS